MRILSIADDMTGALEVGSVFAAFGFQAVVTTQPMPGDLAEVVVVDSETRHSVPAGAAARVVSITRQYGDTPNFIYKKTDSTLRGNIRSELNAIYGLFPYFQIGYVPAYPAQGRTLKDGLLYVNDRQLHETSAAKDVLNPVSSSSVRELIGPDLPCVIFDGENDVDVLNAVDTILADETLRILAGPAAIARALAHRLRPNTTSAVEAFPRVPTCLVVNGSRTGCSELQVAHALRCGCLSHETKENWMVLALDFSNGLSPEAVAKRRAEHTISMLRNHRQDAVFLIGGDTAFAFIAALGHPSLHPISEVLPGIAVSRIANADLHNCLPGYKRDLVVITKAGGFGQMDVICSVRRILEQDAG